MIALMRVNLTRVTSPPNSTPRRFPSYLLLYFIFIFTFPFPSTSSQASLPHLYICIGAMVRYIRIYIFRCNACRAHIDIQFIFFNHSSFVDTLNLSDHDNNYIFFHLLFTNLSYLFNKQLQFQ